LSYVDSYVDYIALAIALDCYFTRLSTRAIARVC